MKKLLTTACLYVVTIVSIVAFPATSTVLGQEKKTADVNSTLAESVTARVDKLFAQWDKPDSPGCALGIVKDGQLIYKRGYGMANLDYDIPISTKSIFDIGSMTKQFTAMSILLLARQGKLSLDDEIQKYLPEIPRYQSPITIQHLIRHTSGIREGLTDLAGMGMWDGVTDDDLLGLMARQKELNFKPGEQYLYSSEGYFLLGLIVKRVSGKSLREFAEENIFKPLGMNHTHFHDDRTFIVKNRAIGYFTRSNGGFSVAITTVFSAAMNNVIRVGHSGLWTSVEDLFLWDQNFYNNKLGGGSDLISEALSTGRLNNGEKLDYAFGLRVGEYKGLKTIRHGGQAGGFQSEIIRFPEQNFSVIDLCNAGYGTPSFAEQIADIFLADQFKKDTVDVYKTVAAAPPIISIPEKELASLTGLYFDPITEITIRRFYMKDGKLMVDPNFNKGPSYVLSPLGQNRFKVAGSRSGREIVFVRPIAGGPMQMKETGSVVAGAGKTRAYDAVQSVTLTSAQLADFTGKYISDELGGATYTLSIKDGKLILQARNQKDVLLTPAFADAFVGDLGIVRFTRNQQNAVSGFTLSTGTVRRLRFNKL
ncbi:MAG: serine hydrolase domain-containing protein [Pyrinomonadaceae bacterium]